MVPRGGEPHYVFLAHAGEPLRAPVEASTPPPRDESRDAPAASPEALLARLHPAHRDLLTTHPGVGRRSEGLYRAAVTLMESGFSDAEILAVLAAHPDGAAAKAFEEKTNPERWLAQEVARIRKKVGHGTQSPHGSRKPDDSPLDLGDLPENIDTYVPPARPWLVEGRLLRGAVSVLASPAGVGKSAFEIASGASVAGTVSYTGEEVREHGPVWIYNNEEDRDELIRRYLAFCRHHGIRPSNLRGRLRLSSGYGGRPLVIARRIEPTGEVIPTPRVTGLIQALRDWQCAAFSVDPLVSTHRVNENSNVDLEEVMTQWRKVAAETGCAIELPSHIPKTGGDSEVHAGNLEAIRGASAIGAAARQVVTLARMSTGTAERYGIAPEERLHLVRLDRAKGNYSPPAAEALWLKMRSVCLDNHLFHPDWVGVFETFGGKLTEVKGTRDKEAEERASRLRVALIALGMGRGESRRLPEIKEELASRSGLSLSWIYKNLPTVLPLDDSEEARLEEAEFTWSKKARPDGGQGVILVHRTLLS